MSGAKSIVYFAYLGDEHTDGDMIRDRLSYMDAQLAWLSELIALSGEPIRVLVPYVAPQERDAEVQRSVSRQGFAIDPECLGSDRRNTFEYRGFRTLQALARRSAPDDLIHYCHSKGIVHLDPGKQGLFRFHTEAGLLADLTELVHDPALTRAGLFPSRWGWCWYNFFWIKAGYMAGLAVEESADRYHFEALIGGPHDKEGYRGVLPLIDRLAPEAIGIPVKPWYRAEETSSPTLFATYDRYAAMASPVAADSGRRWARRPGD